MRSFAPWILVAACLAASACDDSTPDAALDAAVGSPDGAAPAPDGAAPAADAGTGADASADAEPPPDADRSADADPSPDALPPVPPSGTWFVEAAPGATASAVVTGGELVLRAEGPPDLACTSIVGRCASIDVFQRGLRGDFDVTLDVASFSGPPHTFVFLFAEIEGQLQHVDIGDDEPLRLRIHRENDRLVMSWQRPGEAEHADMDEYWPFDLRVGIGLIRSGSAEPTVAHLTGFQVTGGGGQVKADAFDEDGTLFP
jgi:hypothetical protein